MKKRSSHLLVSVRFALLLLALAACRESTPVAAPNPTPKIATPRPLASHFLPDDWTAGGPYTGRITSLFAQGDSLYAGGWHSGVYRTRDGQHWAEMAGITGNRDVLTITGDGDRLWAGTFAGEIFLHEKGIWTKRYDFAASDRGAVYDLDFQNDRLLAATGQGLYLSNDAGATFREIWRGTMVEEAVFTSFGEPAICFGTVGRGLGLCRLGGSDCQLLENYPGAGVIIGLADFPRGLLIAAEGDGLYQMKKDGAFIKIPLAHPDVFPTAVYVDSQWEMVAAANEGLFIRRRNNETWELVRFPATMTAIAQYRGEHYVGTDGLGVFTLKERSLISINDGLINFPVEIISNYMNNILDNN